MRRLVDRSIHDSSKFGSIVTINKSLHSNFGSSRCEKAGTQRPPSAIFAYPMKLPVEHRRTKTDRRKWNRPTTALAGPVAEENFEIEAIIPSMQNHFDSRNVDIADVID